MAADTDAKVCAWTTQADALAAFGEFAGRRKAQITSNLRTGMSHAALVLDGGRFGKDGRNDQ